MGVISADDFHRTLAKIETRKQEAMREFIKHMPYFQALNDQKLKSLIYSLNRIEYVKGQIVIKEGIHKEKGNEDVYFVLQGEFTETKALQPEESDPVAKKNQQAK